MKSRLNENGYIDLHSHILFDVDDGAADRLTSVKMLEMAYRDGIRMMIATPHYHPVRCLTTKEQIRKNYLELCEIVEKLHPDMQILLGREVLYTTGIEEQLENSRDLNLNESEYVLVEFSAGDSFQQIRSGLNNILLSGNIPVLAHVERYPNVAIDWQQVIELHELGVVIQANAASIMGEFGWKAKRFTRRLLKERLIDIVATDAHSTGKRAPLISQCVSYIDKRYGSAYATKVSVTNPYKIILNEYLED